MIGTYYAFYLEMKSGYCDVKVFVQPPLLSNSHQGTQDMMLLH